MDHLQTEDHLTATNSLGESNAAISNSAERAEALLIAEIQLIDPSTRTDVVACSLSSSSVVVSLQGSHWRADHSAPLAHANDNFAAETGR